MPCCMSHVTSFLSGRPPAQRTFGVAMQNFGMRGPGLPAHEIATRSLDTLEQQPQGDSATRNTAARPHFCMTLRKAIIAGPMQVGCRVESTTPREPRIPLPGELDEERGGNTAHHH